MRFSLLNRLPIISGILFIRDAILLLWSWISRNVTLLKVPFFFTFTVASIRAAVGTVGLLWTKLTEVQSTATQVGSSLAISGSPQGTLLDKINAVLPVGETIAFFSAYVTILLLTTAYMFIKHIYNAIPAKAT